MTTRIGRASALSAAVLWLATLTQGTILGAAGELRLLDAVQRQDRNAVRTLLRQGTDVNAKRGDGLTALASAVHLNDMESVNLLLAAGANVNAANDLGVTPLMLAVVNTNPAMVERLLQAKADPKGSRATGNSVIELAARTGNVPVLKLLLGAGAPADPRSDGRLQTPLMFAAAEGHAEAAKFLIEVGANVEARTTATRVTMGGGHYINNRPPLTRPDKTRSVITILWPKDGDEDNLTRYEGGMTPLLFAIDAGHESVVRELLKAGAKVDAATPLGLTPLQFAMIRHEEALALLLLENGADPNGDSIGFAPLHVAAYTSEPAVAKALIAKGADVNRRMMKPYRLVELLEIGVNVYPGSGLFTKIGSTPFMAAAYHGQTEMMRMLLAAGANPYLTARGGETALILAGGLGRPQPTNVVYHTWKESEQLEAIKICLELGLDINGLNQWSQGALHGAAFHDDAKVIEFLVANGAWIDAPDWQDQTPLRIAQGHEICCSTYHNKLNAAAALVKLGADPRAGVSLKFAAHDYESDAVKDVGSSKSN